MVAEKKQSAFSLIIKVVIVSFVVSLLGYIDYITGEISIDILYIFFVGAATWYVNVYVGILTVVEIMCVKIVADYYDNVRVGSHVYEWNSFSYTIMFLIVCLLVGNLKKALTK